MINDVRLTPFFTASVSRRGYLHSKFRRTINFLFPSPEGHHRLLTILKNDLPLVPDSLSVSADLFSQIHRLPINTGIARQGQQFQILDTHLDLSTTANAVEQSRILIVNNECEAVKGPNLSEFSQAYQRFTESRSYHCGFDINQTGRAKKMAKTLTTIPHLLLTRQKTSLMSAVIDFVGMGQGLTPAFDDALIGMMAVMTGARLYAESRSGEIQQAPLAWIDFTTCFSPGEWEKMIESRTTDVSAKYLYCAYDGFYSDPLVHFVTKLFSHQQQNWQPTFDTFAQIGGSSGYDMLYGASLAVQTLAECYER